MQYAAIILAIAGVVAAQAGLPTCATPVLSSAISGGDPTAICKDQAKQAELAAALEKVCGCEDLNKTLAFAKTFCPDVNFPVQDCSAASSSAASAVSSAASSISSAASSVLESVSSSAAAVTSSIAASASMGPMPTTNGTITSATPTASQTGVSTGAASVAQVGGVALVGAFFAALAL